MNFSERLYQSIVHAAQNAVRTKKGGYFETHHIVPRCMGGTEARDNLVLLTAREHFLCHYLLVRIYGSRELTFALHRMTHDTGGNRRFKSARLYEAARRRFGAVIAEFHRERFASNPELREQVAKHHRGKTVSRETRERISVAHTGKTVPQNVRQQISATLTGRKNPKLADRNRTPEIRAKFALAKQGAPSNNRKWWKITSPDGDIVVTRDRKEFCITHGLNWGSVKTMTQKSELYKGFRFERVEDQE